MNTLKKLTALIMTVIMLITTFLFSSITASANGPGSVDVAPTGKCGDNVYWDFDKTTGKLVLNGTGDTYDYEDLDSVFYGNKFIKTVIISNEITSVGDNLFFDCSELISISIPESVETIGIGAFYHCVKLTSIEITKGVKTIDDFAFGFCSNLKLVNMEYGLKKIGVQSFRGCVELENIELPNSVEYIDEDAFAGCKFNSVNIPDELRYLSSSAFTCINFTFNKNKNYSTDKNGVLYNYDKSTIVKFPENSQLTNYVMPDTVKTVGKNSFARTKNLKSITFSQKLEIIESGAFEFCNIDNVVLPNSLKYIGGRAFSYCENLKKIDIPYGVKYIGDYAFDSCINLIYITIPETVDYFFDNLFDTAFYNNKSNWENGMLYIGSHLIKADKSLTGKVYIKEGTKTISEQCFIECQNITDIFMPDSIVCIGTWAFRDCTSLKNIKLSNNLKYIGEWAFDNTLFWNKLFNDPEMWEDGMLYYSDYLLASMGHFGWENIWWTETYPNYKVNKGTKAISGEAFYLTFDTSVITLSEPVEIIPSGAFAGSSIGEFVVPDGVKVIDYAFYGANNLKKITIPKSVEYINSCAFDYYFEATFNKNNPYVVIYCYKDSYAHQYAIENGYDYVLIDEHTHAYKHIVIPADCVTSGMEYDICPDCGDVINSKVISATGHSWGEWKTTLEPTGTKEGKAERKCTKCSATETKAIEKLNIVKDEKTGIEIEYKDQFDKNLEIKVEEKFDGKSYQLLDMECENSKYHLFDITTYENGKKVQPDGKVTVRIPLPDGFSTKNLLVCHVDVENNKVTYIPAKVVGNFVEFSAEHFSDYAVVELSGIVEKVNVNDVELKYKKTAKITPEVTVDGDVKYTVKYDSSNPSVATVDKDGKITTFGKGETKITCTVTDSYGNTVKDTCTVTVKFSFGQWLIWILLFGFLWY